MNSLFVGPYRQNNLTGLTSLSILHHLAANVPTTHNLCCRNIYTESVNIDRTNQLCDKFLDLEHSAKRPDIIIQHVPVDSVYLNRAVYNICIPIIDSRNIEMSQLIRLAACNKILVDNSYSYQLLSTLIPNKISLINYSPIIVDIAEQLKLGVYQHTQKLYFVGTYAENMDLLHDLILTFIVSMSGNSDVSLLLFLTNMSQKDVEALNKYVQQTYNDINVSNIFTKVIVIPIQPDLSIINNCHKTGDVYLAINDNPKNALNINYAKYHNKRVIDWSSLTYEYTYRRNKRISSIGFHAPLQNSLVSIVTNCQNEQTTATDTTQPIEQIIWE